MSNTAYITNYFQNYYDKMRLFVDLMPIYSYFIKNS